MKSAPTYWDGRAVLITGASRGIGRATALWFAERGAHVIVHGRDHNAVTEVCSEISAAGGRSSSVLGDLRSSSTCEQVIESAAQLAGQLDVLVNNAGANVFRGVLDATIEDWDDCLNLDLRAVWLCSKTAARVMRPGSSIINITSNHATSTLAGVFPYNVAKAGANALTQSLAIELADQGIRVVAIAPGYVDTPINDTYFASFPNPSAARRAAEKLHIVNRLANPTEIAAAIEFFADTSRSGFTTGNVVTIDGGRSALLQDPGLAFAENGDEK
ncbi:SDR family oxidoreductase [Salinibacterium sp. TMP30]|uniref:SDR family NAD(P)-dependent oxidoreductase n=1 Tax=Salinibacterium sp. TMP30 TaxID=3138237 RepID=UPI00313999C5